MSDRNVILVLESKDYSKAALNIYQKHADVVFAREYDDYSDVWALVVRLGYDITEDFLCRFRSLKYIVSPTTGLNHIDLDICAERSIEVLSLKGRTDFLEKITSTTEHSLALMLSLVRQIPAAHVDVVDNFHWDRDAFRGRQLSSMSIGLIGLGRIGVQMAVYVKALGMKVLAYDPYIDDQVFSQCGVDKVGLDELLSSSDVVSIHADYRPENEHFLNSTRINKMKSGAFLVNTARGELLDEGALLGALKSGVLGGAAIDVLDKEHKELDLSEREIVEYARHHNNLIITPHLGGCTSDAMHITEEYMANVFHEKVNANHDRG